MTKILCSLCQTEMKLQESIEGGDDTIERYACPVCGKEVYGGRFSSRPLTRTGSDGSRARIFYCTKCNIRTSGIVLDVKSECRWCPLCRKPLFQYDGCCRGKLEKSGTLCTTCCALNIVRSGKPIVDESMPHSSANGAWNA